MKIRSICKHHPFQLGKHIFTVMLILFLLNTKVWEVIYALLFIIFSYIASLWLCVLCVYFFNIFEGVIFAEIKSAESTICSWSSCSSVLSDLMS